MRITVSSGKVTLVFPDEETYEDYKHQLEALNVRTYKRIRDEYGVFAGNQDKFVRSRDDMNKHDPNYMEKLYDKYYDTE